jgi:hypothetical protein
LSIGLPNVRTRQRAACGSAHGKRGFGKSRINETGIPNAVVPPGVFLSEIEAMSFGTVIAEIRFGRHALYVESRSMSAQ